MSIGIPSERQKMDGKMKVLGITGGVGSGKSTVLDYLENKYHARVIQADGVGKLLQQPGEKCYQEIVRIWGQDILQKDGCLDRGKIAALVFQDGEQLCRLNQIMHPGVKRYIMEQIEEERSAGKVPFVVVEAALLLEDHYDAICDEIWYIHTDRELRIRRLEKSRGYSRGKAISIMNNQMSEAEFRQKCKFVIDNSSDFIENTYEQIDKGLIEHGFLQYCQRQQRQQHFCRDLPDGDSD